MQTCLIFRQHVHKKSHPLTKRLTFCTIRLTRCTKNLTRAAGARFACTKNLTSRAVTPWQHPAGWLYPAMSLLPPWHLRPELTWSTSTEGAREILYAEAPGKRTAGYVAGYRCLPAGKEFITAIYVGEPRYRGLGLSLELIRRWRADPSSILVPVLSLNESYWGHLRHAYPGLKVAEAISQGQMRDIMAMTG